MITDSTNIAHAFSFVPITWYLGGTIGPLIGGTLERPTEKFPAIFGDISFLEEYPYFLPCFISATYGVMCWFIVALFLKETVKAQMSPTEYFLGRWHKFQASREDSPAVTEDGAIIDGRKNLLSFRELLTGPVLIAAGCFASFAILDISFCTMFMFPVYLATPMEMGGLGLDPPVMGTILATIGISTSVFQLFLFSPLHNRLGGKNLFLTAMSLFFPVAALFPIASRVGQEYGLNNFVWLLVGVQILLISFANFALSVSFVFVNSAAPNRASIDATTGFAQMVVSGVRAIGPSAINSAFALGIQKHVMGGHFAYWMMAGMTAISLVIGAALPKRSSN
ncbi:hypothetical protein SCLCIDRAFT_33733 [Scleroderma citrinum Foug A]|uniref:Major facilitator superfamily (MFS) profile domain-containing protein n=1 Tax=Scleroderma citrinum Foug A TaxID=1036808 RepID=A0A0C2ZDU8_9AGAM|nr:hypothetical protein SCLCIDRAFT_33733 [Scleroderma citrinum Foug A]